MNKKIQKALVVLFVIQTLLTGLILLSEMSNSIKINALYRDSYSSAIVEDGNK